MWDVSKVTDMTSMFHYSSFEGDISNWKPINVVDKVDMFLFTNTPLPYWGNARNNQEIISAIKKYELFKKMEQDLVDEDGDEDRKTKI